MLKVITVTNQPERAKPLVNSLQKNGWDFDVLNVEWKGFGTKLIATYRYLKDHPEVDRFIFCDAHDVVVLGSPNEFESKVTDKDAILFNSERGCWPPPVQQFEYMFKKFPHRVNFLNSGVYYAPSKRYMEIFEANTPQYSTDDQWLLSMIYLFGRWPVTLDNNCDVFQCYSFIEPGDYSYNNGRVQNLKTGTEPIFLHANGGGGMDRVYALASGEEVKTGGIRV